MMRLACIDAVGAEALLERIGDAFRFECVDGLIDLDFGVGNAVGGDGHGPFLAWFVGG
jgi:hypothetical protein